MTKKQFEDLKKWFFEYVATYYGGTAQADDDIKLKEDHTRRMLEDTVIITKELGFDEEQTLLAQTISLLHDTGRFEQYKLYGTYNDSGTVNHSTVGLKVIGENKLLDGFEADEKNIIEKSIALHGVKDLPNKLNPDVQPFAKLIRDIDKLDIFYVMLSRIDELRRDPQKCKAIFGYSATDECSPHIIKAVTEGRTISYDEFKTMNDMILGLIGWIYDINYTATLKEIKKRNIIENLFSYLPDTPEIGTLSKHIMHVLNERIFNNR